MNVHSREKRDIYNFKNGMFFKFKNRKISFQKRDKTTSKTVYFNILKPTQKNRFWTPINTDFKRYL